MGNAYKLYSGGIDNTIKVWDGRKDSKPILSLPFHSDSITSLKLNKDQSHLLSNSMDKTLCIWDIGTFINKAQLQQIQNIKKIENEEKKQQELNKINTQHRLLRVIKGIQHNHERLLIK